MRVWEVKDLGLDNLTLTEKGIKSIADDEILVEMKAATLNYRDLIMIDGSYLLKQRSYRLLLIFQMELE